MNARRASIRRHLADARGEVERTAPGRGRSSLAARSSPHWPLGYVVARRPSRTQRTARLAVAQGARGAGSRAPLRARSDAAADARVDRACGRRGAGVRGGRRPRVAADSCPRRRARRPGGAHRGTDGVDAPSGARHAPASETPVPEAPAAQARHRGEAQAGAAMAGAGLPGRRQAGRQGRARHGRRLGHRPRGRGAVRARRRGRRDQFPVERSGRREGHGCGGARVRAALPAAARRPRTRRRLRPHRRAHREDAGRARHPRVERRAPEPQGRPRRGRRTPSSTARSRSTSTRTSGSRARRCAT